MNPTDNIMALIIGIFGLLIGLIGFGYAVYQGSERKKLQKLARTQAWVLYNKANNLTGIIQTARSKYIERYKENTDPEVSDLLSKSSAFGLEAFRESVRQIQISEPKFDFDSIALWEKQEKITSTDHKRIFTDLVIDDKTEYKQSSDNKAHDTTSH
jgi:hypothetical protein